jgi:hypothetical protein
VIHFDQLCHELGVRAITIHVVETLAARHARILRGQPEEKEKSSVPRASIPTFEEKPLAVQIPAHIAPAPAAKHWFKRAKSPVIEIKNVLGEIIIRIPGRDLSRKDFRGLCFDGAVLDGFEFWGSVFDGCSMVGVRASRTSFRHCSMKDVDLSSSRLEKSLFACAHLEGASLHKSNISKASFEGAWVSSETAIPDEPGTGRCRTSVRSRRLTS